MVIKNSNHISLRTHRTAWWLVLAVCVLSHLAFADSFFDLFTDTEDGAFDITQWLGSQGGFMPVPIVITEPAVGYGGGVALVFFHDSISNKMAMTQSEANARMSAPSLSAAAALRTENGTWAAGGLHMGVWRDDTIRYVGGAFYASANLTFYGNDGGGSGDSASYNIEVPGVLQELKFRVGESDAFVGLKYLLTKIQTDINFSDAVPGLPDKNLSFNDGGLALTLVYDAVDSPFTPSSGIRINSEMMMHNGVVGGDYDYANLGSTIMGYTPLNRRLTLGTRFNVDMTAGNVPFLALPYINLRGIPVMRYQNTHTATAEFEMRWDVTRRWSLVGFAGSGWAAHSIEDFPDSTARIAGGTGIRYLIARGFRLRTGFDIAWGPEDTAFYLTVGNAWAY